MIKKIAVIGAGVIGSGWIIRLLAHDKKVIAGDRTRVRQLNLEPGDLQIFKGRFTLHRVCLLYTSPSPRDGLLSRMPSSA